MFNVSYWFVFALVFLCLVIREGGKVGSDNRRPAARLLRRLFELCRDGYRAFAAKRGKRGEDGGEGKD